MEAPAAIDGRLLDRTGNRQEIRKKILNKEMKMGIEEIVTKKDLAEMEQRILQAISDKVKTKDRTLNIDEAVKHIRAKNRSTIYKLTSSGEIAYLKVGKSLVFWESDLNRYLARQRKSSNDELAATAALRAVH